MKSEATVGRREQRVAQAEQALERRHTRQAERLAEALVREDPSDPQGVALLAQAVAARGQIQRAIRLLLQAGGETHADISLILARILAGAGRLDDAQRAYLARLRHRPQDTEAWLELAALLNRLGDLAGSGDAYGHAIRSDPTRAEGYLKLGELLQRGRAYERAVRVYRQGLEVLPRSPELLCDLGAALMAIGQVDEAAGLLNQSLTLKPVNDAALFNLGSALLKRGDFEAAECRFDQLLKLRPHMTRAWQRRMLCRPQNDDDRARAEELEALLATGHFDPASQASGRFALGKLFDDLGEHDRAFEAYAAGNQLRREQHAHDPAASRRMTQALIDHFTAETIQALTRDPDRGGGLVYLVGAPRSGLALTEQLLGGHSQVASASQFDGLIRAKTALFNSLATGAIGYPEAIAGIEPGNLERAARRYLEELPVRAPWVSSRRLENLAHVGLIKLLFPAARLVFLRRDHRDTGLSMFFTDFVRGQGHSFDLDHLADYLGNAERLMVHWRSLWPDDVLDLNYEQMIGGAPLKQLMEFLGLEVEPNQIRFHERRNAVPSASAWALRQPLNRSRIGRWKAYRAHLGPLLSAPSSRI